MQSQRRESLKFVSDAPRVFDEKLQGRMHLTCEQTQERRKQNVGCSGECCKTPEEDEDADENDDVVHSSNFLCPVGAANAVTHGFAIADQNVGEDDPDETSEVLHRLKQEARLIARTSLLSI